MRIEEIVNILYIDFLSTDNETMDQDKEFDTLLADLQANPSDANLEKLSNEQLAALTKKLSPYEKRLPESEATVKTAALLSTTHLREDYQERLILTSLLGFLHTVAKEQKTPPEIKRWTPTVKTTDKLVGDQKPELKREPFSIDKTISKLEKILGLAKTIKHDQVELKKLNEQIHTESVVSNKETNVYKEMIVAKKQREDRLKVLNYLVTYEGRLFGIDADVDMDETLAAVKELPDGKNLLDRHPPRAAVYYPRNYTLEAPQEVCTSIIKDFLRTWFEYDPANHVRKAHNEYKLNKDLSDDHKVDLMDPERPTMENTRIKPKIEESDQELFTLITKDKQTKDAVTRVLRDGAIMNCATQFSQDEDLANRFRRYLSFVPMDSQARVTVEVVPPQDTYHRFQYYRDVNYEELRSAVAAIYDIKPDLENCILIYKTITGTDDEIEKARADYQIKNLETFKSDVLSITFGAWHFIDPFKKNRSRINFYNKNTEVMRRIMDRIEDDKSIGKELMKNRVHKEKAKNIQEAGPDAPGLSQYRAENKEIGASGAQPGLTKEQMLRLEKSRGDVKAAKNLEFLEQKEKRKVELEAARKEHDFTPQEEREYREVIAQIKQAREMIEMPDDAVAVGVHTYDPKSGDFTQSTMYTKAEAPEFVEEHRKKQMEMMQNSGLAMIPGPHRALIDGPRPEVKKDDKKQ